MPRVRAISSLSSLSLSLAAVFATTAARAQPRPAEPTGAPPPEAKAVVEAPKAVPEAPTIESPVSGTSVTASAGGQFMTGNSRMLAGTANGVIDSRFGADEFGAGVLGNYGQGAPPGRQIVVTTENLQGRVRYDRYFASRASAFLIVTGRRDRFQGLDFRLNLDPGIKYLFVKAQAEAVWAEAGYDFQYDVRRNDARAELDASGNPVLDAGGQPVLLAKTETDHSARLFAGLRHSFNSDVTLGAGLEYLQSVIDSKRTRLNFDAVFAAKVVGGLAVGLGCSLRYDNAPLPGKENLDTTTTLSLIYSHTDTPAAKPE
jgi:hypothetical protein